jgi:23S rRNA pseudouridine1911/1915/1917 synthase
MIPIVIYEESDFLVINKPAGLIVHCASPKLQGSEGGPRESSVVGWLLKNYPEVATVGDDPAERAGIVHRLDRDTSGVMIIPRTQEAFLFFKNLFQTKTVHKTYLALVYGAPKEQKGTIDKPIGLNSGTVKRTVHVKNAKMVKDAVTDYEVIKTFDIDGTLVSLIRVSPRTGRTHQIRVHMASINCPVVGDALYGPKKQTIHISRQFLHADSIEFPTPRGNRLTISADMPPELAALIR